MSHLSRPSLLRVSCVLAICGIGLLATLPALARGEEGRGQHKVERGFGRFLPPPGFLDLTDAQKASAEEIRDQTRSALEPLVASQKELRRQMREAVTSSQPNATAIGELVLQIHTNRERFKQVLLQAEADFVALLNAEQKEKYEHFRELRDERREHRRSRWAGSAADDEI